MPSAADGLLIPGGASPGISLQTMASVMTLSFSAIAVTAMAGPRLRKIIDSILKRNSQTVIEDDEETDQEPHPDDPSIPAASLSGLLRKHHRAIKQQASQTRLTNRGAFVATPKAADEADKKYAEELKELIVSGFKAVKATGSEAPATSSTSIMGKDSNRRVFPLEFRKPASFTVICGESCRQLRIHWGLEEQFWQSVLSAEGLQGGGVQKSGKSGSLFWFTSDSKFVLKTVEKHEIDKAIQLLPELVKHSSTNPNSLLVHLCGFYTLKVHSEILTFCVMTNAFPGQKPQVIYDLKGTTEDRWVAPMPGKVLKDLNFADKMIGLEDAEGVKTLQSIIDADADFLARLHIMDYSLLLGVRELAEGEEFVNTHAGGWSCLEGHEPLKGVTLVHKSGARHVMYELSIIDVLQDYNWKKKVAHFIKSMSIGWFHKIDTEPPAKYARRFKSYFHQKVQSRPPQDQIAKFLDKVKAAHTLPTSRPLTFPKGAELLDEAVEAAVRRGGLLILTNPNAGIFRSKHQEVEAFIDVERYALVFQPVGSDESSRVSVSLYSILEVFPSLVTKHKDSRRCADCGGPMKVEEPTISERRFTIKVSGIHDLRFHAPSRRQMKLWVTALEGFKNFLRQEILECVADNAVGTCKNKLPYASAFQLGRHWEEHFIERHFRLMDEDHSGDMDIKEVEKTWIDLNINPTGEKAVAKAFRDVAGGQDRIGKTRFRHMIYALDRGLEEGVQRFFNDALAMQDGKDMAMELTAIALQQFLKRVQGEDHEEDAIQEMLDSLDAPDVTGSPARLTLRGFARMICSEENMALAPPGKGASLYWQRLPPPSTSVPAAATDAPPPDENGMDYPLTDYWLSSSHNTYLEGNQLSGRSSALQYVDVLHRGCRCVEIDVWDGPDGDPIVKHGYTVTTWVAFEDVIQAIKDHAFSVTPFPLVISIEQNCQSTRQLLRQGQVMEEIFGDSLIKPPVDSEGEVDWAGAKVPTPMEARQKFIVKSSVCSCKKCKQMLNGYNRCIFMPTMKFKNRDADVQEFLEAELQDRDESRGWTHSSGRTECHCTSFTEDRIEKWVANEKQKHNSTWRLKRWHTRYFSRTYPKGTRVDSSNFDPVNAWSIGVQMVALNYQTPDLSMLLNEALFESQNLFGMVLKSRKARDLPAYRKGERRLTKLKLNLMSGHRLPRAASSSLSGSKAPISSPYVVVSLTTTSGRAERRSEVVNENGFDPMFDFAVEFSIAKECDPELIFLVFQVIDRKCGQAMAHAALPVKKLRQGVRWVRLCRPIGGLRLQDAGLLVHIELEDEELGVEQWH